MKLTSRSREFEACQREKLRYQHRARKLQSDLRSLSWLSSNSNENEKKTENKGNTEYLINMIAMLNVVL